MKQIYLYSFLIIGFLLFASPVSAQISERKIPKEVVIEELSIYPNPASGEKVNITTKTNSKKTVEIYNALGKPVLSTLLSGTELNISSLEPGIYIMKIREGRSSATRKLVVR